jgi:ABC-type sugar transport system substrate-binding protein
LWSKIRQNLSRSNFPSPPLVGWIAEKEMSFMPHLRSSAVAASCVALLAAVTACSSHSVKQGTGWVALSPITVAMITHQTPGDAFWDLVRKGAQDAAAKNDVTLRYYSDPSAAQQAELVQNAIDQHVDGIALTLAKPNAMADVVRKAKAQNIPVVAFNSGISYWQSLGALEYFGSDEAVAGTEFGERLNSIGAKHALCVIQEQGQVALETRCASLKKAFHGRTDTLYVSGRNAPDVQASITAKLQQDPSIDQVVTLGAPFAMIALQSVDQAGSHAKVATFDTNKQAVEAIQQGKLEWAVDQQPYLQGYLAVEALALYKANGDILGGNAQAVLTGPSFVDRSNVALIATFAARGTR